MNIKWSVNEDGAVVIADADEDFHQLAAVYFAPEVDLDVDVKIVIGEGIATAIRETDRWRSVDE